MARFHFNVQRMFGLVAADSHGARRVLRALPPRNGDDTDADGGVPARGPGWFESSWELVRGLEVREGLPGNAGLNEWLALCLAGPPAALREAARARLEQG